MPSNNSPSLAFEEAAYNSGRVRVAGIDEAGRGPLAGPVVAGAVVLPRGDGIPHGLNDSKKLSVRRREQLFEELMQCRGIIAAVGMASVEEIDSLNILKATHLAMKRAVLLLAKKADFCLIDGLPVPNFPVLHQAIVGGDSQSLSIAAASILAKVTRDRMMDEADQLYPVYGFSRNKGYGTKEHMEALRLYGPCPLHRRSFGPVAQLELPFP